jgi:hypothetical protein
MSLTIFQVRDVSGHEISNPYFRHPVSHRFALWMDLMMPLVLILLASSQAGTLAVASTVTVAEKSSDDSAVRKILQGDPTYKSKHVHS